MNSFFTLSGWQDSNPRLKLPKLVLDQPQLHPDARGGIEPLVVKQWFMKPFSRLCLHPRFIYYISLLLFPIIFEGLG